MSWPQQVKSHIKTKSRKRDNAISAIRLLAFLAIVACHVCQFFDWQIAWWLNVGVQVFLCISGYLYGQREIPNTWQFIKKNFVKILVPYYIVVILAMIAGRASGLIVLSQEQMLRVLLLGGLIPGGEHLWFVSTILLCYLVTPLMLQILTEAARRSRGRFLLAVAGLCATTHVAFYSLSIPHPFNAVWINCYLMGLGLGLAVHRRLFSLRQCALFFGVLALQNILQIYWTYVHALEPASPLQQVLYATWCDYNHVWLGVALFLGLKLLFDHFRFGAKARAILRVSDKYSYIAYLVHQFFILSAFSVMALTQCAPLNLAILGGAITLATAIVSVITKLVPSS